ncbi:MAG: hypothetical protein U9R79_14790 [Armatimonadota bacterium]|nr:hypothetical protein [Armatimonadota bacterium]
MTPTRRLIPIALLVLILGGARSLMADPTPAQQYLDRLLAANAAAVRGLDEYVRDAEIAAELLVRDPDGPGPTLWLAGEEGFVLEGFNRAGGLMIARRLAEPDDVTAGDVVLVGSLVGDDPDTAALLAAAAQRGALCVLFAPRRAEAVTPSAELLELLSESSRQALGDGYLFIAAHADPPRGGELPVTSPALAQSLWAFTGELVTAMMRSSGRIPPIFKSVLVPGGRERNNARKGLRWDPQMAGALPAGLAARKYLAKLANSMRRLRASQAWKFTRAGRLAAEVMAADGTVYCELVGHMPPSVPAQVPEHVLPFTVLESATPEELPEVLSPGDLVLYVGYYEPFGPWVERTHEAGARIVTVVSGTPERAASAMGADINICGCWPWGDALIGFYPPETDIRMLPPSGVIQSAAFWMLVAETRSAVD